MKTFKDVFRSLECKSLFLNVRPTLQIDSGFISKPWNVVVRVKSFTLQSMFCRQEESLLPRGLLDMEQSDITPDLQNFNLTVPPDNSYVHQCFKMANLIYLSLCYFILVFMGIKIKFEYCQKAKKCSQYSMHKSRYLAGFKAFQTYCW